MYASVIIRKEADYFLANRFPGSKKRARAYNRCMKTETGLAESMEIFSSRFVTATSLKLLA